MKTPTIRTQAKTPYTAFPPKSFLLYGEPKTGKTSTAAKFPGVLVLNTVSENGTGELDAPIIDIETPAELVEVCEWLKANPGKYQTVVLDGATTFVIDEITRHPSRDYRRSVKEASAELVPAFHAFLKLPLIRIITAHSKRETSEIKFERNTYNKIDVFPNFPPSLRLFIEGRVDAFGYCYPTANGNSKCWWTPYDTDDLPKPRSIAAGNRLGLSKATELSFAAISNAILKPE